MRFFLIFHHNLAFSSIPQEHYPYIIDSIYSRILDLAENGIPLGLEYTGETLELIADMRPEFILRLKELWHKGYCDVIGSSYSQAIFPLIPAQVNRWNLDLGNKVIRQLFGRIPDIAYLNEQVYSESLPPLYQEQNYRTVIFDWLNAAKDNEWLASWRYLPALHRPTGMKFLWSDSICFQKFQRVIWNELDQNEWWSFLADHQNLASSAGNKEPILCLYASDAEVFDYYPGGLATHSAQRNHWDNIAKLLLTLVKTPHYSLNLPSALIQEFEDAELPAIDTITTPSYPIRTKKQDHYNVTRWAVSGREATKMNTQCFQLLHTYNMLNKGNLAQEQTLAQLRKDLVILWGSDFRTNTTDEKLDIFRNRIGSAFSSLQTGAYQPTLRNNKGVFNLNGRFQRWHTLPSTTGMGQKTDISQNGRRLLMESEGVSLVLLKNKGLAIEDLSFSALSGQPLLGTIPHGAFSDISLGSDFFSGHIKLVTREGQYITDVNHKVNDIEICSDDEYMALRNKVPMEFPGLSIVKTFIIGRGNFILSYDIYARGINPTFFRLGAWTIKTDFFSRDSFFLATHLGGDSPEQFKLGTWEILQDQPVNHVVTARHCLGNTEGILTIGDAQKQIQIKTDHSGYWAIPLLHYKKTKKSAGERFPALCRLFYSICEMDDVSCVLLKGHYRVSFQITPRTKLFDAK